MKEVPTQFCARVSCPNFSNVCLGPPESLEFMNEQYHETTDEGEFAGTKPPPCMPDLLCCSFLTIDKQSPVSAKPSKSWVLFPPQVEIGGRITKHLGALITTTLATFRHSLRFLTPIDWIWRRKLSSSEFSLELCPFQGLLSLSPGLHSWKGATEEKTSLQH